MRKGFKGFMNKVFKVVWSKSKECYVVVPEIAKNNSGKKKVLASVLAGLALVGVGAQMGTPVDAYRSPDGSVNTQDSRINIAANAKPSNSVGVTRSLLVTKTQLMMKMALRLLVQITKHMVTLA